MIKAYIKSSKGNLLVKDEVTTLSVILKDNEKIIPLTSYNVTWCKVNSDGSETYLGGTKTINVKANSIGAKAKYICKVCVERNLTDNNNVLLTDAQNNQRTANLTLYKSQQELFKSTEVVNNLPVNPQDYTFLLANRSLDLIGHIVNVDYDSVDIKLNLNAADELTFNVYKTLDDIGEPTWWKLIDLKLVYVRELNEYFQITVQTDDGCDKTVKTITGTSLCEAELSQINLNEIEINTENDIARDNYVATRFYNPQNVEGSLLHRILEKAPGYTIGHVDSSLTKLQRSFSIDGTDIYSFLTGDCAEQFNCLFKFDSATRTINVYDLYTVCLDCGYRGEFNDICPECGSTNLSYFGKDTTIYVDKDNLTDNVTYTTNVDSIKNCLRIEGGDDQINAAIRAVLPNGSNYIYYLSDEQKADMSSGLKSAYKSYEDNCKNKQSDYIKQNQIAYDAIDQILYLTSSKMPTIQESKTSAKDEMAKLTVEKLSPVGLTNVSTSTSVATANAAVRNLAKYYIKSGYFKVEVDTDTKDVSNDFQYVGTDSDKYHYGTWYGRLIVTNYSDEKDVATTPYMRITINDNYQKYLDQKIKKHINKNDDKDGNVYNILSLKFEATQNKATKKWNVPTDQVNAFKQALTYYSLNRLISFHDAIQGVINILVEEDQAKEEADWYGIYYSYYQRLKLCQSEMNKRKNEIKAQEKRRDEALKQVKSIQKSLDLKKCLGNYYEEFCLYHREDTYSNDNFISDGLSNKELLNKAKELIEDAKKELYKSGERQHSISATLDNLLVIDEFASLVNNFKLGNWLRINCDGSIYRLRLISYEVNFGSLETINVEFSDVTKTVLGYTDINSIKNQASSLAGGLSYVKKQAEKGVDAKNYIGSMLTDSLNASALAIKNADTEDIVINQNGIRLRSYNDVSGQYDRKQAALIHNMLVFTDDDWEHAQTALGEIKYTFDGKSVTTYGVSAQAILSGVIISGDIYSANYCSTIGKEAGTHFDLESGAFRLGGDRIVYNTTTNKLTLKDIMIEVKGSDGASGTKIVPLEDTVLNVDRIIAKNIDVDNLVAKVAEIDIAKIKELYADSAFINSLNASYIKTDELVAKVAEIGYLKTDELEAKVANIDLANIKTLYGDSAFIKSLNTITSTTVTSTVSTEFVKGLIAGQVTAQELFTDNFTIGSDGYGKTVMNGSTMQFQDEKGNVFIQLGTDVKNGHSLIIKDSNGTALFNGKGVTENAIADGLIVNKMVKKKDGTYTGISSDALNIDDVTKTVVKNGNFKIDVAKVYYDSEDKTLKTYLGEMQNKISADMSDKIAANKIYQAYIDTSNGKVLGEANGNSTTLTCILSKNNEVIDEKGTQFRYLWKRKTANKGKWDGSYSKVGKSVIVAFNDIAEDYIYYCYIYNLTDVNGNLLTDTSGNTLTGYYPMLTTYITIAKNLTEELHTKYYTKDESKDSVITILGSTDIQTINGKANSIVERINSTVSTCDSITTTLSNSSYKSFAGLVTRVNKNTQTVSEWSSKIETTNTAANNAVTIANSSIKSVEVQYIVSDSPYDYNVNNPTTWASGKMPQPAKGKFIWTRTKTSPKVGDPTYSEPACISGVQGDKGDNGIGITSVVEHYAVSSSNTTPPTTWITPDSTHPIPTTDTTNRFLWNYETITYSDKNSLDSKKRIIGTYGKTGKGVGSVINYYLASGLATGITTATTGWGRPNQVATVTATNKYLWNYEVTKDTDGNTISTSTPCIIGVYGDKGNTGVGVKKVVPQYIMIDSKTEPPSQSDVRWSDTCPNWRNGKFIWTRSHLFLDNGKDDYSDPVLANGLNDALDKAANSVNLLRNSETLIYDSYIIGNMLTDASENVLTDKNGNILVA